MSLTADLVYELKNVADPVISPDGQRMVYTKSWAARDEASPATLSRLMLIDLDSEQDLANAGERAFTQGNADGSPRFSPDGANLAFLRSAQPGEPRQIWVIPTHGGEARQLTTAPKGVQDYAWSPDGGRIVYCADTAPPGAATDGKGDGGPRVAEVNRLRYRHDLQGWRGDFHYHLYVIGLASGEATTLTHGDWDDFGAVWSPDGSKIAFISGRREDRDSRALTEAYVVPAEGGEPERWSGGLSSVGAVAWAPDSSRLVAVASDDEAGMVLWQGWLYILQSGGEPGRITDDKQRPTLGGGPGAARQPEIRWTGDGRILFLGEHRGQSFIYQASPEGKEARQRWGGGRLAAGLSLDGEATRAVVSSSSPAHPSEIHLVDLDDSASCVVVEPNSTFLASRPAASMEKFSLERAGYQVECRLWFPPGFDAQSTYPLVLDIHGGPNGAFYDSYVPWQQALASSGYLVLAVNPRGSSTYGNDFMRAVLDDWGGEDYLDLMAAVDTVCQREYVNQQRLGIHGYSYGGYMTTWTIGHARRFGAAVVGAPCTNLYTMYGTSDIGISFGEPQWGWTAEESPEKLLARSPISHAAKVTTPVLLLHGEADARCPVGQSEEYFVALKRLGKTVEFVRFPDSNHSFPRTGHPRMREEYMTRMLNWFNIWLT